MTDYNLSLRVMEASGKLQELVAKQEEGESLHIGSISAVTWNRF